MEAFLSSHARFLSTHARRGFTKLGMLAITLHSIERGTRRGRGIGQLTINENTRPRSRMLF